jgi:hypothetical protein
LKCDFVVTWIEPPFYSDKLTWQSKDKGDPDLPATAQLYTSVKCAWELLATRVPKLISIPMRGLHIEISKFGQGLRAPAIPNRRRVQFSSYEHRRLPKSFSYRAPGLRDIRTGARSR